MCFKEAGMAKAVQARIKLLAHEEGGRLEPARDGIRPQLELGEIHTSCIVRSICGDQVFDSGVLYDVEIEIPFWEHYSALFDHDDPVRLFDGSRLIATGTYV
jgi:hypothetical protein